MVWYCRSTDPFHVTLACSLSTSTHARLSTLQNSTGQAACKLPFLTWSSNPQYLEPPEGNLSAIHCVTLSKRSFAPLGPQGQALQLPEGRRLLDDDPSND